MRSSARTARHATAALVALAALAASAACSTVAPRDAVEEQVMTQLRTETADCPSDRGGTVGSTFTCTATAGGETFQVTATVTSVTDGRVAVALERAGDASGPGPGTAVEPAGGEETTDRVVGPEVAAAVSDQLALLSGRRPDSVTCPDLPAAVGSSIRCNLVAGPDTLGVTVRASSVRDGRVEFDIEVDDTPS